MGIIRKMLDIARNCMISLMFGLKNTENEILTSLAKNDTPFDISQETNEQRVSKALLKGEVTQEVKELRYRTYKVDKESKQYEYFSPTLAKKRERDDNKFIKYDNSENLDIITIQYNEQNVGTVEESLENAVLEKEKLIYTEPKKKYNIIIERNCVARYRIEEFLIKLAAKRINDKNALLDFYVSMYVDDKNKLSKGFISEIGKIIKGNKNNDILDIDSVRFITNHAYKKDDMLEYEFNNLIFKKIIEYDGNYIIKFTANIIKDGYDTSRQYFCAEMAKKYKNKEKKSLQLDFTDNIKIYTCEMCGKKVAYDIKAIESVIPSSPDDNVKKEKTNTTEYMDMQITKQTYGKALCSDCLRKYLSENMMKQ